MGGILKTAGFYLLVGPPTGALALILLAAITDIGGDSSVGFGEGTANVLSSLIFILPLSYLFGGAQALITGAGTALWERMRGRAPLFVPMVLSAVMWLGSVALVSPDSSGLGSGVGLVMLPVHLVAGAVSWWILRKIRKEGTA